MNPLSIALLADGLQMHAAWVRVGAGVALVLRGTVGALLALSHGATRSVVGAVWVLVAVFGLHALRVG